MRIELHFKVSLVKVKHYVVNEVDQPIKPRHDLVLLRIDVHFACAKVHRHPNNEVYCLKGVEYNSLNNVLRFHLWRFVACRNRLIRAHVLHDDVKKVLVPE